MHLKCHKTQLKTQHFNKQHQEDIKVQHCIKKKQFKSEICTLALCCVEPNSPVYVQFVCESHEDLF